jgi:hypothetical protein
MSNYDENLFVDQEKKFLGFQKLLQPTTRQAIMLIEAPQDMGKTWLINKMGRHCQEPTTDIPVVQIDFRNPYQVHAIQDRLGLVRLLRDKLEYPRYFNNLNRTINSFSEAGASGNRGLAALRQKIEQYFNLDELTNLTFDLSINYENLSGETLQAKSRELVNYAQRHNLLRNLVELCATLRSQVDWWQGLESLRQVSSVAMEEETAEAIISDDNAPIWADSDMERQRANRQINSAFFECLAALLQDRARMALLLNKLNLIITGRKTPDLSDLDVKHLLVQTTLEPFTEEDIRVYFEERRKVSGLDIRTIVLTSGGVPGALAMMADHAMVTAEGDDDFFSDL